jgi:hypothetical protein
MALATPIRRISRVTTKKPENPKGPHAGGAARRSQTHQAIPDSWTLWQNRTITGLALLDHLMVSTLRMEQKLWSLSRLKADWSFERWRGTDAGAEWRGVTGTSPGVYEYWIYSNKQEHMRPYHHLSSMGWNILVSCLCCILTACLAYGYTRTSMAWKLVKVASVPYFRRSDSTCSLSLEENGEVDG